MRNFMRFLGMVFVMAAGAGMVLTTESWRELALGGTLGALGVITYGVASYLDD